jgi:hypothetical protein
MPQVQALIVVAILGMATCDAAVARPRDPPVAAASHGSDGDYYTNVSGHRVHRPMQAAHRPVGATAQCRDSSYSFSEHRRGTCSHHGGVATWY